MTRRNISARIDIDAGVLRQRRDLYAIAIGLMLFYAAGGGFLQDANVGSMFAVHLKRPEFVLLAAWLGFFYFWFRFWLISEEKPFGAFWEDVLWQAGDSQSVRRIASRFVFGSSQNELDERKRAILRPRMHVPKIKFDGLTPRLSLNSLRITRGDNTVENYGPLKPVLEPHELKTLRRAVMLAVPKAVWLERSFTDYTLPHLFAIATMVVALISVSTGHSETKKPRGIPEASARVAPVAPRAVTRSVPSVPPAAPSTAPQKPPNVSPKADPSSAVTR